MTQNHLLTSGLLSRRLFLGAAGGTIVAAAAAPAWAQGTTSPDGTTGEPLLDIANEAAARPMPKMEVEPPIEPERRVGYCVVGLGQFALNQIIPSIGESRMSKLVALVSGDREKAETVAEQYGVSTEAIYNYDNFDEIAENDEIDIVYIILPNSLHAEFTVRAFEAGKHVMCEKPMAVSVEECEQMIAAAETANRKLMIAYRAQYEPFNLEAIRMIRDGELGTIRSLDNVAARPIDLENPADEWRVVKDLAGGGSLMDIGIYALNGARYLLGEEPVEISATISNPEGDERFTDVEDILSWRMRFPSGVIANCLTGYSFSGNRFSVYGSDASLTLEPATDYYKHGLRVMTEEEQTEPQIQEKNQFALEMDHLAEAVLNDTPVKTPGEEGLQDVRLMLKIYEAAETGAPVTIDWSYQRAVPAEQGADQQA
ncbi:glucose-fructose oxidoreductase [Devosia crocina]|uniref:Glucose-fructose oxidoreductase n=1 Tax=Devosia crocina TaxID=429728 RepID=A0A1I7MWY7_9HYPH|nr:Gfo/Idh/MocA family oxidoreductase [Devosia crocina]SFV26846.1 glucose-fructose oxidoreductase [Devosia crocina]